MQKYSFSSYFNQAFILISSKVLLKANAQQMQTQEVKAAIFQFYPAVLKMCKVANL